MEYYTNDYPGMKSQNHHMKIFNWQPRIVGLIVVMITLSSCAVQQGLSKKKIPEAGADFLVSKMKENQFRSEYFNARFVAEIKQGRKTIEFNGQVRSKTDSLIWVTISPTLGIEMGRLVLTTDSLKWINRFNASYILAPIARFTNMLHPAVNFGLAEAFLLGNDVALYDDTQFEASVEKGEYVLRVTNRRLKKQTKLNNETSGLPTQNIWIDPVQYRITKVLVKDKTDQGPQIEVIYRNFEKVGEQQFAGTQTYLIKNDGKKTRIKLNFSRIDTQPVSSFPFSVPPKYNLADDF